MSDQPTFPELVAMFLLVAGDNDLRNWDKPAFWWPRGDARPAVRAPTPEVLGKIIETLSPYLGEPTIITSEIVVWEGHRYKQIHGWQWFSEQYNSAVLWRVNKWQ